MTIDIGEKPGALESYRVCLKMLFADLENLNDEKVNAILKHYSFTWTEEGRVGLELPKLSHD